MASVTLQITIEVPDHDKDVITRGLIQHRIRTMLFDNVPLSYIVKVTEIGRVVSETGNG